MFKDTSPDLGALLGLWVTTLLYGMLLIGLC
jgi:hypothetical protein